MLLALVVSIEFLLIDAAKANVAGFVDASAKSAPAVLHVLHEIA